jgi:hypothetical protein
MMRLCLKKNKKQKNSWALVAMPAILASWEAEIGRIKVQGQPGKIVCVSPPPK